MERDKLIQLVSAAKSGDSSAMEGLFENFYNDVYYFALKTVKDSDLACDITQETFAVIISTLKDLKEPAAFVTWMKQVTYSQCTRYFRKKKEVLVDEDEDGATVFDTVAEDRTEFIPGEALDQEDFRKTILGMLDTLSEEQRAAVMLYYYDELSVKQIAQIQGVSEGTVKSRLNYARKAIKSSVEDYEKRNGVKLHSVALLPLLYWLFASSRQAMPANAAQAAAAGVSAAASTAAGGTAAAAGAGAAAKAAVMPLLAKVVAGVAAISVAAGGIGIAVSRNAEPTEPSPVVSATTMPATTEPETTPSEPKTPEPIIVADTVPEAGSYIVANGPTLGPGEPLSTPASSGDQYITQDYTYKLVPFRGSLGWQVWVRDTEQETYEALCARINGCPLVSLEDAFRDCAKMTAAPAIPDTVVSLVRAYWNCSSLREAPELPDCVNDLWYTFYRCTSLVTPPVIPDGVTELVQTFSGCASLVTAPAIPQGVTDLSWTFDGCVSLRLPPEIPEGVVEMQSTFADCTSLEVAPKIPSTVTNMCRTFAYCTSLEYPPEIPEGVTDISWLFFGCKALLERPEIPSTVIKDSHAFQFCNLLPDEE